jgi:glutathione S-transferase
VRKVMLVAHACALIERIALMRSVAAMRKPNLALMADNPLNKTPTLLLDDGTVLYDSTVICEYSADLAGDTVCFLAVARTMERAASYCARVSACSMH